MFPTALSYEVVMRNGRYRHLVEFPNLKTSRTHWEHFCLDAVIPTRLKLTGYLNISDTAIISSCRFLDT